MSAFILSYFVAHALVSFNKQIDETKKMRWNKSTLVFLHVRKTHTLVLIINIMGVSFLCTLPVGQSILWTMKRKTHTKMHKISFFLNEKENKSFTLIIGVRSLFLILIICHKNAASFVKKPSIVTVTWQFQYVHISYFFTQKMYSTCSLCLKKCKQQKRKLF